MAVLTAKSQRFYCAFFAILLLLSGCGDPVKDQINQQLPVTQQRVEQLKQALDNKQVRNANLILQYADKIEALKPEYGELITEFRKEATTQGPMYLALLDRVATVQNQPQMFASSQDIFDELINIYQAADPVLYSDALSDPLNVLADMSGGALPRVNSLSKSQSMRANNAQDFGVGEQLVGNPSYGQWTTDSSGMSFWAWYGMFSLMDDLFDYKRKRYYNNWGRYRNYSYYNDYGRTRYSSPSQLKKQTSLDTKTRKSFASRGQKFNSAYSKNRSGASSLSSQSKSAQSSANRFRSSSTNKSSFAKSSRNKNASFRNSRTSTSRGFRRGK